MSTATRQREAPIRLSTRSAAERLDVAPRTVRKYVRTGVLHPIGERGSKGRARCHYFDPTQVAILAAKGEAEARNYAIVMGWVREKARKVRRVIRRKAKDLDIRYT